MKKVSIAIIKFYSNTLSCWLVALYYTYLVLSTVGKIMKKMCNLETSTSKTSKAKNNHHFSIVLGEKKYIDFCLLANRVTSGIHIFITLFSTFFAHSDNAYIHHANIYFLLVNKIKSNKK